MKYLLDQSDSLPVDSILYSRLKIIIISYGFCLTFINHFRYWNLEHFLIVSFKSNFLISSFKNCSYHFTHRIYPLTLNLIKRKCFFFLILFIIFHFYAFLLFSSLFSMTCLLSWLFAQCCSKKCKVSNYFSPEFFQENLYCTSFHRYIYIYPLLRNSETVHYFSILW